MEQKGERERTEDLKKGSHRSGSREDEKDKRREERREEGREGKEKIGEAGRMV